jgi:flagellar motor protein MotB
LNHLVLLIDGHTDSLPVSSATSVGDNDRLGLARAEVVRNLLQNRHGIPETSVRVSSIGERDPPYSNDDPESRNKNRTVVLRLVPRE